MHRVCVAGANGSEGATASSLTPSSLQTVIEFPRRQANVLKAVTVGPPPYNSRRCVMIIDHDQLEWNALEEIDRSPEVKLLKFRSSSYATSTPSPCSSLTYI